MAEEVTRAAEARVEATMAGVRATSAMVVWAKAQEASEAMEWREATMAPERAIGATVAQAKAQEATETGAARVAPTVPQE